MHPSLSFAHRLFCSRNEGLHLEQISLF